jgi:hypothetical protein
MENKRKGLHSIYRKMLHYLHYLHCLHLESSFWNVRSLGK